MKQFQTMQKFLRFLHQKKQLKVIRRNSMINENIVREEKQPSTYRKTKMKRQLNQNKVLLIIIIQTLRRMKWDQIIFFDSFLFYVQRKLSVWINLVESCLGFFVSYISLYWIVYRR